MQKQDANLTGTLNRLDGFEGSSIVYTTYLGNPSGSSFMAFSKGNHLLKSSDNATAVEI